MGKKHFKYFVFVPNALGIVIIIFKNSKIVNQFKTTTLFSVLSKYYNLGSIIFRIKFC